MIDFRYHVVSIVAVFLALTVGLVIGSSYLSKVAYDGLNNQLSDLRGQVQTLHGTQTNLEAQIRDRDSLITALGPQAVKGKLTGHEVSVIVLPGADRSVGDAMAALLVQAGADVSSEIYVKSSVLDPGQTAKLSSTADLAARLQVSNGSDSTPGEPPAPARAFTDIATAVIGKEPTPSNVTTVQQQLPTTEVQAILMTYSQAGFLDVKAPVTQAADMAVLIAPSADSSPTASTDNLYYLGLAKDLNPLKGTVIAGPAAATTSPGLLAASLKDDWTSKNVSTADSADLPAGRIITVFALAEELTGKTGHYGLTATADGPLPNLQ